MGASQKLTARRRPPRVVFGLISLALALMAWTIASAVSDLPMAIVPSPGSVATAGTDFVFSGDFWPNVSISLARLGLGATLGIVTGVALGVLVGLNRSVRTALEPLVNAFSGIAGIAWIPLAFAWLGAGMAMSTFVIWNGVFFVVFANTALGVSRVASVLSDSVRTLGGGRLEVIRGVILPGAMPDMLTGVRVGLSFAWRALVAAELLGAPMGLGQWINEAAASQRSDRILAGCLIIAALGILLERLVVETIASRTVVRWGTVVDAVNRGG